MKHVSWLVVSVCKFIVGYKEIKKKICDLLDEKKCLYKNFRSRQDLQCCSLKLFHLKSLRLSKYSSSILQSIVKIKTYIDFDKKHIAVGW